MIYKGPGLYRLALFYGPEFKYDVAGPAHTPDKRVVNRLWEHDFLYWEVFSLF